MTLLNLLSDRCQELSTEELKGRISRQSGNESDHVERYLVFGAWKLAVILQQNYVRWLRGQTEDARFATLDEGARHLFRLAAERRA